MKFSVGPFDLDVTLGGGINGQPVLSSLGETLNRLAPLVGADMAALSRADDEAIVTSDCARAALEAAGQFQLAFSPDLMAAALADFVVAEVLSHAGGGPVRVDLGHITAWAGPVDSVLRLVDGRPPLACDLAFGLTGASKRAVALGGKRSGAPHGFPDAIAVLASHAVRARAGTLAIEKAISVPSPDGGKALAAEVIWDALSQGARIGQRLKGQKLIEAAVLTAKGRGRTIGSLKPDPLIRFGVSDWR
jgi:hypothetical protein